jgi:acyl-CoA thioesterase-1
MCTKKSVTRSVLRLVTAIVLVGAFNATGYSEDRKVIVFFGDSLTEGFGVDPEQAYPAIVQQKVDEAGLPIQIVNAGLSGETTAAGLRRVSWILKREVDVFVLALGGNDGLRGIPVEETEKNLNATIERVRGERPEAQIVLFGIDTPPNMGESFRTAFRELFSRVATKQDVPLLPFFIEGVGGVPEMNLPDGIHPNEEGHKLVAENVWSFLLPLIDGFQ